LLPAPLGVTVTRTAARMSALGLPTMTRLRPTAPDTGHRPAAADIRRWPAGGMSDVAMTATARHGTTATRVRPAAADIRHRSTADVRDKTDRRPAHRRCLSELDLRRLDGRRPCRRSRVGQSAHRRPILRRRDIHYPREDDVLARRTLLQ